MTTISSALAPTAAALPTAATNDTPAAPPKEKGIPGAIGLPLLIGMMVVGNVAVFGHFSAKTTALMGAGLAGIGAAAAGYEMVQPGKSGSDRAFMGVAGLSSLAIAGMALRFGFKH